MDDGRLLERLGCPAMGLRILNGDVSLPDLSFRSPQGNTNGFPPAMVPLAVQRDSGACLGWARNWFGSAPSSFVFHYWGGNEVLEIALTEEQLAAWLVAYLVDITPEDFWADEIAPLAAAMSFRPSEALEDVFAESGPDQNLGDLREFATNQPQLIVREHDSAAPAWARSPISIPEIESRLSDGDLEGAWHGLNSSQISLPETYHLLCRLHRRMDSGEEQILFKAMVETWTEAHFPAGTVPEFKPASQDPTLPDEDCIKPWNGTVRA